jgi:hypothetical protein
MCLEVGGHSLLRTRDGGRAVLPIFPGVYGHAPGSLLFIISVHSGSLSMLSANASVAGFRRVFDPKNPRDVKRFQNIGNFDPVSSIERPPDH